MEGWEGGGQVGEDEAGMNGMVSRVLGSLCNCLGDGHKFCKASASRGRPGPLHRSAVLGGKTRMRRVAAGKVLLG